MSSVMQERFRIDFSRNKIDVHGVQPVRITGRDLMRIADQSGFPVSDTR